MKCYNCGRNESGLEPVGQCSQCDSDERREFARATTERDDLRAQNAELLEALRGLMKEYGIDGIASFNEALSVAEKAIAKAGGS